MGSIARVLGLGILSLTLVACDLGGAPAVTSPSAAASAAGDALQRGLAAHTAGRIDEAISLYYQVLAKDPTNKFAFFNLGQIEHTRNHPAAAEAFYRLALESDKNMTSALYNLALLRQAAGDSAESAALLRRFVQTIPNDGPSHWNLGLALRSLGQTAEANAEFARAQQLDARLVPPAGSAVPRPSPTR